MPARIRCFVLATSAMLMTVLPARAQSPSFDDLLAQAKEQAAAGHRLSPPGDNMAETVMTMMSLIGTATADQLAELSALLESEKPQSLAGPTDASPQTGPRRAQAPAVSAPSLLQPPPAVAVTTPAPAVAIATATPDQPTPSPVQPPAAIMPADPATAIAAARTEPTATAAETSPAAAVPEINDGPAEAASDRAVRHTETISGGERVPPPQSPASAALSGPPTVPDTTTTMPAATVTAAPPSVRSSGAIASVDATAARVEPDPLPVVHAPHVVPSVPIAPVAAANTGLPTQSAGAAPTAAAASPAPVAHARPTAASLDKAIPASTDEAVSRVMRSAVTTAKPAVSTPHSAALAAPSPPDAQPRTPRPITDGSAATLIAPGRTMIDGNGRAGLLYARGLDAELRGDISGARRFYESAAHQGDAGAARNLGRLYDPVYLRQTALGGVDPNPDLARLWYERAVRLGDAEAGTLLEAMSVR